MGVPVPPLVLSHDVSPAAADGARILINPTWFRDAMTATRGDPRFMRDAAIGILGHELDHLIQGDIEAPDWATRSNELRADWVAGVVCARLGVSAEAFAVVIWQLAAHHSTDPRRHPGVPGRDEAARNSAMGCVERDRR
jgi:hypothetical protein